MYKIILLFILLLSGSDSYAQSGWTRKKGEGFFLLKYRTFSSNNYFNLSGESIETNRFRQSTLGLYGELGLTDRLTAIVNFPVFGTNGFTTTETVSGIGDLQLELKYALPFTKFPVAVSLAPVFPTAKANNFAQSKNNGFDRINLPIGDGEFNLWTILAASQSLKKIPLYFSFFGAYNFRTAYQGNEFSDQFLIGTEIGYQIFKNTFVNGKINTLSTIENVVTVSDFVRGDGTEYTSYSVGIFFPIITDFKGILEYQNYSDWLFSEKNIYSAAAFNFGLIYNLKPKSE
jgi:hypothetical protein